MTRLRTIGGLAGASIIATGLGFCRDLLLTARFPTETVGHYLASFQLGDLALNFLVFGSMQTVLVPQLTRILRTKPHAAAHFMSRVLTWTFLSFAVVLALLAILTPAIIPFILKNSSPGGILLVTRYTQLLLLQTLVLALSLAWNAVLVAHNHYAASASAPIVYNLTNLLAVPLAIYYSDPLVLVGGTIMGALLHLAVTLAEAHKLGIRVWPEPTWDAELTLLVRALVPRSAAQAIFQLTQLTYTALASRLGGDSLVGVVRICMNLGTMPLKFLTNSLGTTLLRERVPEERRLSVLGTVLQRTLALSIPLAIGGALAAPGLLALFHIPDTTETTRFLVLLFVAVIPGSLLLTLSRFTFAQEQGMRASLLLIIDGSLAILLAFIGTSFWHISGIALAEIGAPLLTSLSLALLLGWKPSFRIIPQFLLVLSGAALCALGMIIIYVAITTPISVDSPFVSLLSAGIATLGALAFARITRILQ